MTTLDQRIESLELAKIENITIKSFVCARDSENRLRKYQNRTTVIHANKPTEKIEYPCPPIDEWNYASEKTG